MLGFNYKKAVQAINFFAIKEGNKINKMKALKLVWLSDRLHLRLYGRPIINDVYFALNYGLIGSNTKDLVENNSSFLSPKEREYCISFLESGGKYDIISTALLDKSVFSKTDLIVMERIYTNFGSFNKFKLSDISHKYPEWKRYEISLQSESNSRFEMNYLDFFLDPEKNNDTVFQDDESTLFLSKELFLENSQIYHYKTI